MTNTVKRSYHRAYDQLRPVRLTYNFCEYAAGSVLFELGKTKIACAVSLINSVPPFLKGKKTGWITAEYAMLPTANRQRSEREGSCKKNGRSIEISRIIGRSFRPIVDLTLIGERTIVLDCDVIQADGSTRTACITGAYLALKQAVDYWMSIGLVNGPLLNDAIAAVSVGVKDKEILLDIDFAEDSLIDADFNFVMTQSGNLIEIQGSAERTPISWQTIEAMKSLAQKGIDDIFKETARDTHEPVVKQKKIFNQIRIRESNQKPL